MPRITLATATLLAVAALPTHGQPQHQRFMGGPVTLAGSRQLLRRRCDEGQRVRDGARRAAGAADPAANAAANHDRPDVRAVPDPARLSAPGWPVIMVHGSTHTGAALESTPDGREGWYPYFVRKGVATYVVDQSGRGRSGFDQSVLHEAEARLLAGNRDAAAALLPTMPAHHRQRRIPGLVRPPAAGRLDDRHGSADSARLARGSATEHGRTSRMPRRSFRWRPSPSTTSSSCRMPKRRLPGSTCTTCMPQELSPANTWTPQNLATLVERLGGAIVATHSQSGIMGHHMIRILKERGRADLVKGLITVEGGCSLAQSGLTAADFDAIPYLAVKGDYTAISTQCQESVDAINARRAQNQGSAKAEYMKLDELGMLGVTHMMMLDANNLEIADLMLEWAGENVPRAPRR